METEANWNNALFATMIASRTRGKHKETASTHFTNARAAIRHSPQRFRAGSKAVITGPPIQSRHGPDLTRADYIRSAAIEVNVILFYSGCRVSPRT